ncbi:DUF5916 domain-containing protein [Lysobacter sp. 5GHs7-4]|uniref:DUF5916 domain-containing protein n=1 Tax=Lysobacter sp. 5GHs7-4 TaxID=2904253 RepID=UPI001E2F4F6B|nr:DUF5916 domain-containing protein [Lysobacter sp. 5GHs7-4]UHQ23012.1 DUF5916 domain-containing protein [Lysobacter sp. 5GHs7-4]
MLSLGLCASAQAAIVVDGKLDEPEWEQARRYRDFKVTEPFRLDAPAPGSSTQARLLSTPDGIAVAFELEQSAAFARVKPRLERDQNRVADRVNVSIDFDGDGRGAYSFSVDLSGSVQDGVIANENLTNLDWDTDWSWAVSESADGWQAELLIPWSVATMRGTDTATRKVNVYFSRTLGSNGERQAYPALSPSRGRFVSGFETIEIPQYRKSLLHIWPYLTANHDLIGQRTRYNAGVDVFWKPSPGFQLSATVNPDFGQVESDDLVINFDAVETFYSDRRPFFTENQSIFDLTTPDSGRLIHTRRIGAEADDGSGASDIDVALKLNGSVGALGYGLLAASEDGEAGRDFYAARLQYPLRPGLNLGWLGSLVQRPYRDREAQVQALDLSWKPNPRLIVNAQALGSFIEQAGRRSDDSGAWLRVNWTPSDRWRYELEATHFGRRLDFNDLGFQRRASLNELELTAVYLHRIQDAASRLGSTRWTAELQARGNDSGDRLPTYLLLGADLNFRSGDLVYLEASLIGAGWDDLISRGNGLWRRSGRYDAEAGYVSRRYGDWSLTASASLVPRGLSARPTQEWVLGANWYPDEAFNASFEFGPDRGEDWLIWEGGRDFGRYARRGDFASLGLSWFPGRRHELRLKSEWVAVRGSRGQRYRLQPNGQLSASGEARPDFDVNNFGLQLRYRYLLGPQSDVFLAYSRGGYRRQERDGVGGGELFDDALGLRDADQLLAKIRYRF